MPRMSDRLPCFVPRGACGDPREMQQQTRSSPQLNSRGPSSFTLTAVGFPGSGLFQGLSPAVLPPRSHSYNARKPNFCFCQCS